MRINITLRQLEILLREQKQKTVETLAGSSYLYNTETTEGSYKTLTIDKEKMMKVGIESSYPDDFKVLQRFIIDE